VRQQTTYVTITQLLAPTKAITSQPD